MRAEFHAYNKDSQEAGEKLEVLLSRMPKRVKPYRGPKFSDSLVYAAESEFYLYIGHVDSELPPSGGISEKDRVIAALSELDAKAAFIHCSSVGRQGKRHRIEKGVPILELQPSFHNMFMVEWNQILQGLNASTAAAIVAEDVPSSLRKFFEVNRKLYLLPALCVLCQGYLAVHSSPAGKAEVGDGQNLVERALAEMGWTVTEGRKGILQSDEAKLCLTPCLLETNPASIPEDGWPSRNELQAKVKTVGFWSVLFSQGVSDTAEIETKILDEWGDEDADKRDLVVALVQNLVPLADDESNADASCEPGPSVVANAYFALHVKLGGKSE